MVKRIVSIMLIFAATSIAWIILGNIMQGRTYLQQNKLFEQVEGLWGSLHTQTAPAFWYITQVQKEVQKEVEDEAGKKLKKTERQTRTVTTRVNIDSSDIKVGFDLTQRQKGLMWYDTYLVDFQAVYTVKNPLSREENFRMQFVFPAKEATYDNIRMAINGRVIEINDLSKGEIEVPFRLGPYQTARVEIRYASQGLDKWFYRFGEGVNRAKDFTLAMKTNFSEIDFPQKTISPTTKTPAGNGWNLEWKYSDLLSGFAIGMDMPNKLNPGPLASQISYFAPVSLLFFFFVVFMISTIKNIKVHPMNYVFLAAAFFAFHLLFSYSVDHIDIVPAFLISSVVSMFLVISYMRIVVGARFAAVEVGLSQFIFLVLFSLAHFFEGYTGLTVTIGAILTLGVMMQLTAKIDWEEKFRPASSASQGERTL